VSDIKKIETNGAPKAIGPYSQGISAGGFVFVSGQIGLNPATGVLVEGNAAKQAERVLMNLSAILDAAGSSLSKVVRCDVYLSSLSDFSSVNEVYASYFNGRNLPARATVEVAGLPKDALVEISCIAVK
jgi:2-iminobutanoate/2-iminopropanoate deaminase